jgi:hypothetical protein
MPVEWRPIGGFWLSAAELTAAIGRPLCDPIADVRDSELEWPLWVDSSRSRSSHFGQYRSFVGANRNGRLRIRKQSLGQHASYFRS